MIEFPNAPPNFLETFRNARQAGEDDRFQSDRRNALASGDIGALRRAGDFQSANALDQVGAQNTRKQVLGQYGQDPAAARTAAFQSGDSELVQAINALDDRGKAEANENAQRLGAVAFNLRQRPLEDRPAALQQLRPALKGVYNFTDEQLAAFDPSDAALDAIIAQAMTVKDLVAAQDRREDNVRADRTLQAMTQHRDRQIGLGQDRIGIARQRESRTARGGGAAAPIVPSGFVLD